MGKRDTFRKNILAVTRCRSFKAAMQGWKVDRIVQLDRSAPMASCELCGQRFRKGGMLRWPNTGAVISVGGDCIKTILVGHFGADRGAPAKKKAARKELDDRYYDLIDRGGWIAWIRDNAPKRLAGEVAELVHLGYVRSEDGLQKLIRFHDRTRLYPTEELLVPLDRIRKTIGHKLPDQMTITDARKVLRRIGTSRAVDMLCADSREQISKALSEHSPEGYTAWQKLSDDAKDAAAALLTLTRDLPSADPVCDEAVVDGFCPMFRSASMPQWAWNRIKGCGLVAASLGGDMAEIYLWRSGRQKKLKADLKYWKSFRAKNGRALRRVLNEAFDVGPSWL